MGTYVTPPWLIENDRMERPTEILVPLMEGVGPVWMHQENRGAWYAYIATKSIEGVLDADTGDGMVAECSHGHATADEAWECAGRMGRAVASAVLAR
jgi:hypothetical protein